MATVEELRLQVKAEVADAVAKLKQYERQTKANESANKGLKESFADMRDAMQGPVAAAKMVVDALQKVVKVGADLYNEYAQAQRAAITLSTALRDNGNMAAGAQNRLADYASQLQKTSIFEDDATIAIMANLAAMGLSEKQITDLVGAASNLAAATGIDLDTAVKQLNATLQGNAGILGRQNAEVKALTKEQLMNGDAIEIVNRQYADQAKVVGESAFGATQKLKNEMGSLKEAMGEAIAYSFQPLVDNITTAATKISENISGEVTVSKVLAGSETGLDKISSAISYVRKKIRDLSATQGDFYYQAIAKEQELVKLQDYQMRKQSAGQLASANAAKEAKQFADELAREAKKGGTGVIVTDDKDIRAAAMMKAATDAVRASISKNIEYNNAFGVTLMSTAQRADLVRQALVKVVEESGGIVTKTNPGLNDMKNILDSTNEQLINAQAGIGGVKIESGKLDESKPFESLNTELIKYYTLLLKTKDSGGIISEEDAALMDELGVTTIPAVTAAAEDMGEAFKPAFEALGGMVGLDFGELYDSLTTTKNSLTPVKDAIDSIGTLATSAFGAFETASNRANDVALENINKEITETKTGNDAALKAMDDAEKTRKTNADNQIDRLTKERDEYKKNFSTTGTDGYLKLLADLEEAEKTGNTNEITRIGAEASAVYATFSDPEKGYLKLEADLALAKKDNSALDEGYPAKRKTKEKELNDDLKILEDELAKKKEDLAKAAWVTARKINAAQIAINAIDAGIKTAAATGDPVLGAAVGAAGLGLATYAASMEYETGSSSWKGLMDTFGRSGDRTEEQKKKDQGVDTAAAIAAVLAGPAGAATVYAVDAAITAATPATTTTAATTAATGPKEGDIKSGGFYRGDEVFLVYHDGAWWKETEYDAAHPTSTQSTRTAPIDRLASGGIVTKPTIAMIGEAGPEAVIPLSRSGAMGATVNVYVSGSILRERDLNGIIGKAIEQSTRGY